MTEPIVLVHGGAGDISDEARVPLLLAGVKMAALIGYNKLQASGCILDAVEHAVRYLEDDENFNAGKGSVVNQDGEVEMDASIMVGRTLQAGAVTIVKDVKNPITLARRIMEQTEHTMLGAEGAKRFAIQQGLELVEPGALVTPSRLKVMKAYTQTAPSHEGGTVGAVAINAKGEMAAATSTGGRTGKMAGRCSDTSCIGCGTYADDSIGCVSTTGHGESIMRFCLAYAILQEHKDGRPIGLAVQKQCDAMSATVGNTAGAIALSRTGDVGIGFSSKYMSWAFVKGNQLHFGINRDQHEVEQLG